MPSSRHSRSARPSGQPTGRPTNGPTNRGRNAPPTIAPIVLPHTNTENHRTGGFDFTQRMADVCRDMIGRIPELSHIVMDRVALAFAQARNRSNYGLYATLTPLRFEGGSMVEDRKGKLYRVQPVLDAEGREMLYILTFYLPRFMDVNFHEKLVTIVHELWHISPHFDGDLRRHPGRCYAHTRSQADYDAEMSRLADRWLMLGPSRATYAFLYNDFDQLQRKYGRIVGVTVPQPKVTMYLE